MQKESEAYAAAIASACAVWAGSAAEIQKVDSLEALGAICEQFDGGNPATDLFFPMRFRGQEIALQRAELGPANVQEQAEKKKSPGNLKSNLFARAVHKTHKIA